MNWKRWGWPIVFILSTAAVLLAAFLKLPPTIRIVFTLWFTILVPGMALLRVFGLRLQISGWTLAVAISLAVDTTVGLALLYAGRWSWKTGLLILSAITLICTIVEMVIPHERGPLPSIAVTNIPSDYRRNRKASPQK